MCVFVTDLLGVCVEGHSQVQQQLPLLHPLDEGLQTHDNDDNYNIFVLQSCTVVHFALPTLNSVFCKKKKRACFLQWKTSHLEKIPEIDLIFRTHEEKLLGLPGGPQSLFVFNLVSFKSTSLEN